MLLTEKLIVHDELNPKLWKENKLLPEVAEKLNEIVRQFIDVCKIPLHVVDVHLVGSQVSYNYTSNSDLDVHIVSNFELIDCPEEILQAAYDSIKSSFNSNYDITIHGIDVELYVEDIRSTVNSNGIYSLYYNKWIKFPGKLTNLPEVDVSKEFDNWSTKIQQIIKKGKRDRIERLIDKLYSIRKNSLDVEGEYGRGNQLFKELRSAGLIDKLKDAHKSCRSKELSLESLKTLTEASRSNLLSKSKASAKGFQRFKKRVKSRVANTVKQYNSIDMNKLFKEDILTIDVNVKGETDDYVVKITYGGLLQLLQKQVSKQGGALNYKAVTRAVIEGFNQEDVYISCSCPDWTYRYAYYATKNNISSGAAELRPSDITNPDDSLGSACKHVLLVLSNTSFLLKVSSTIYNYINYMQKHYKKLYADIIYPAVYGKEYEEPVQLDIFDSDELASDKETIDQSNEYARTKGQFKQGNTQGVRYASKDTGSSQMTLDDTPETSDVSPEN